MIRGGRRALMWLAAVVVLLPIAEIWLLVLLGRQIGALPVLGLVIGEAILGGWLIRRRWRAAWQSLRAGADTDSILGSPAGDAPLTAAVDTLLVVAGGIALIVPGLITDLVGLVCLLPFIRRLPRWMLRRWLDRRVAGLSPALGSLAGPGARTGDVVEGEVVDEPTGGPGDRRNGRGEDPVIIRGEITGR